MKKLAGGPWRRHPCAVGLLVRGAVAQNVNAGIVHGLQVAIGQQLVELADLQRARAIFSGANGFH